VSAPLEIRFSLDGQDQAAAIPPNMALIDLLRERYGVTGVKASCERGVCGACTVLVDGTPAACGYCTPGMVMLTTALLREHPDPGDEEIRTWISSNICRCTGYQMIIESVRRAAELIREEGQANG
jgi:carbon-monoxide dehydrogenase small subunit